MAGTGLEKRDPAEVAQALFDALSAGRWSEVASRVCRSAAENYKREVLGAALIEENWRENYGASSGDPNRPDTAPVRCRYQDRLGVDSISQLRSLSPIELVERAARIEGDRLATANEQLSKKIIGHIFETADMAHVLYRLTRGGLQAVKPSSIEVLTLRIERGRWCTTDLRHIHYFFNQIGFT